MVFSVIYCHCVLLSQQTCLYSSQYLSDHNKCLPNYFVNLFSWPTYLQKSHMKYTTRQQWIWSETAFSRNTRLCWVIIRECLGNENEKKKKVEKHYTDTGSLKTVSHSLKRTI